MLKVMISTVAATLMAGAAVAQSLNACDAVASAHNIVEPWPVYNETFAKGALRMALLDTGGGAACCTQHLLILYPDPDQGRACVVLSDQPGVGFGELIWLGIRATYNSGVGLLLEVPVRDFDPATGTAETSPVQRVAVRIDLDAGVIDFE